MWVYSGSRNNTKVLSYLLGSLSAEDGEDGEDGETGEM